MTTKPPNIDTLMSRLENAACMAEEGWGSVKENAKKNLPILRRQIKAMTKPKVLTIRQERNRATKMILEVLDMAMWDSAYRKGRIGDPDRSPLRVWFPRDKKTGKLTGQFITIGGFVARNIEGFTEEGIVTDSHGGGMVTESWADLPVEDLLKIEKWVYKHVEISVGIVE